MSAETSPSTKAYRLLLVHSVLIFALAFLATTIVHEGAHAVIGRAFGLHPVLHHNYVETPDAESVAAKFAIPAAGPLVSLVQGVLFLLWSRRREKTSLVSLTFLWLGIMGLLTFFGYVMMAPLFEYGDTGKVFALLGLPDWLVWALAVVSLLALILILRGTVRDFERHAVPARGGEARSRARTANALIAFPVLLGVAVSTLLSLPVPTFLSLLYPLTAPFSVFLAYGRFLDSTDELPAGAHYPDRLSWPLVGVLLALAVVSRLLVPGLEL